MKGQVELPVIPPADDVDLGRLHSYSSLSTLQFSLVAIHR